MQHEQTSEAQLVVNLAKAREIMVLEAGALMPKGAAEQRGQMIATIEELIGRYLPAGTMPVEPDASGSLEKNVHLYLRALRAKPSAAARAAGSPYEQLAQVFMQLSNLELVSQIIEWIQSTHSLAEIPPEAIEDAGAAIRVVSQRLLLQPEVRKWVEILRSDNAQGDTGRNAALMAHHWIERAGLSEAFVNELSRTNLASFRMWEKAKPLSDFEAWLPYFKLVVESVKRKAAILGNALNVSPYQALLEQFNAGLRNETVNRIFTELHGKLPGLIQRIKAKQAAEQAPIPMPSVPLDIQRRIMAKVIAALGYEPSFSRLDESMHPFSTGEWDDVRVTTHYHEDNLLSGIMSVVHEMGHLFYSRNLPRQWKHQPIGSAQSMWIHESQSLFWEKQIGCSQEFMAFLAGLIRQEMQTDSAALSADNLFALITRLKPGFIRIETDEVTYPAHIILRHRIEQDIVASIVAPEDLPGVWAAQMKDLLDVTVPDHAHGCMQDVHWTDGSFGYFPAYSFGALAAAQFMETATAAIPDMPAKIRKGEFAEIQSWLKQHIHQLGSRYDGEALVQHVTGKPLSIAPWLAHIERRYLAS